MITFTTSSCCGVAVYRGSALCAPAASGSASALNGTRVNVTRTRCGIRIGALEGVIDDTSAQSQRTLPRRLGFIGCVVADDLPPGRSLFDDEEIVSAGIASAGGGALKVEAAGDGGEAVVERLHLQIAEGELAHGGAIGKRLAISGEHLIVAAADGTAHEENVRRFLVAGGEGI